jgi:hypothetical protein
MRIGRGLCGVFLAGVFALATSAPPVAESRTGAAPSITQQTLYSFCSQTNCADGATPFAGLIMDGSGNLYADLDDARSPAYRGPRKKRRDTLPEDIAGRPARAAAIGAANGEAARAS